MCIRDSYYVTNLQGDVMGMVDASGNSVATYTYDPYGKLLTATGELADKNPLRYRGYYYDSESGLYYLQSRYYDPATRRFVNADSYASTGQGLIGHNMFAYCRNNAIMRTDSYGSLDWNWCTQLSVGAAILAVGLAILLAAPTGGASIAAGAAAIGASAATAIGGAAAVTGTVVVGDALAQASVSYAKQSRKSGKERATDHPSWVHQEDVDMSKSAQENATEMLNEKYGEGTWREGPGSEYNRIVKWINRGVKVFILFLAKQFVMEEYK